MSAFDGAELLEILYRRQAFEPVAQPGHRTQLYTPFETLLEGAYESRVREAFLSTRRVALIGSIGSGKSSALEYVTTVNADAFAPIWISVNHESDEILKEPSEFARHLIREVVRWAHDSQSMTAEERQALLAQTTTTLPTLTRSQRTDLSFKLALPWLQPGFGREVEETVADPAVERSRSDFIASLDRLVDLIRDELDRTPVLLLDDSDRWLRLAGEVRESLLRSFFLDTFRMLAERNWAVGMAIHPSYRGSGAYREAVTNGYFTVNCEMPEFETPTLLTGLIDARVDLVVKDEYVQQSMELGRVPPDPSEDFAVGSAFEEGFEEVLYDYYEKTERNLRAVLTLVQQSLIEAVGANEKQISIASLKEAALGLAYDDN